MRAIGALVATPLLLAATPSPPRYGPVPVHSAQTAVVRRYVDALREGRFDRAFALLSADERAYFGDASAFAGVFAADGYALRRATIVGARGDDRARVYFVRERIAYVDHADDSRRELDATVPIGVVPGRGTPRIKDPGKPYRAFASTSSSSVSGLRVTVKKVDFYPDRIDVVVRFTNAGDGFVTILPYGRSVLRDALGGVYRLIATRDWTITDKRLYEGIPLAPNAQYTGSMAFATAQRFVTADRGWSLTVAPALRDGSDAPFDVIVPIRPLG
ncbi:MAG TPA: hypothetical protein VFB22_08755 [Candidatus Baltobacteraceae bacterium]|nr:hypothetical protein [Candidatus Baltobacteraceae bacterium]